MPSAAASPCSLERPRLRRGNRSADPRPGPAGPARHGRGLLARHAGRSRRKPRSAGMANIDIRPGDFQSDPPPPGPFHLVVSAMTLHHVRDIEAMLNTFFRLSRPPAGWPSQTWTKKTARSTPPSQRPPSRLQPLHLARQIAEAGFEAVEFTDAAESEKTAAATPLSGHRPPACLTSDPRGLVSRGNQPPPLGNGIFEQFS